MTTTPKPKTRRTDAELRAMHAEKQAALTERMATKADPRIKAARQLASSLGELLCSCSIELEDEELHIMSTSIAETQTAIGELANFLVKQWEAEEAGDTDVVS